MPSPSKKPPTNVKPVPGTIVWVRRRNGSWWPGRIISKKELLASNVMSPRSGTPVKLLGRDDASVDWYNIEKSKRVKAFRCGEFDDCIEKAQAMAGMQNKRREKYARREDAIVDAIELEKEQNEQLSSIPSSPVTSAKKAKVKGKQKSGDGEQPKKEGSRKTSKKHSQVKEEGEKGAEVSEFDDLPNLLPRMRGLQDLVSAGTSSKISSVEGLEGSCELPPSVDDTKIGPDQNRLTKRKRTSGRAEDLPTSKRRDKKKTISQVLETSQRDEEPVMKAEACDGEEKHSDECESAQETFTSASEPSNAGHVLDAHSANNNGKSTAVAASEGTLPSPSTCPSPTGLSAQEKSQGKKEKEKGSKKRKTASVPRTLASLVEPGAVSDEPTNEDELSPQSGVAEQKSTLSRLDGSPNSVCRAAKGKANEETVTDCPSPPKCDDPPKEPFREGVTGPVHPRTRFERQPIPVIRLFSTVIQNSVQGYPISVEVVDEIVLRRTARRTTRQRTPRGDVPMYEDGLKVPGIGKVPKRSKEVLSKKLLKRAVSMTSKKIRTLASISEERGRHPFSLLSSELPPRWPVATSVPVSVAMNRLKAVVCS